MNIFVYRVKSWLGHREAPSRPAIVKVVKKFELFVQGNNVKNLTRAHCARTSVSIASIPQKCDWNRRFVIPWNYAFIKPNYTDMA